MLSNYLVIFYRWWYGQLNLKGAGVLLSRLAWVIPGLQDFPLTVPGIGVIKVDFRDLSAFVWQNYLLGKKSQEQGLLTAMSRYCRPGGVLWDIGANIGFISAYFAKLEYGLNAIHAFEPNPDIFITFQSLFAKNPVVHGHNFALSSENAQKLLHVPPGDSSMGTMAQEHAPKKKITFTIDCFTGDELVENGRISPPTLVKIDVEGHEVDVLKGMKKILKVYKPVVFLEHLFLDINNLSVFEEYSIMTIDNYDGTFHAGFVPTYGHNIVMIPK